MRAQRRRCRRLRCAGALLGPARRAGLGCGPDDVDAVVAHPGGQWLGLPPTRRGYVQAFKDFHRFLVVRKSLLRAAAGTALRDVAGDQVARVANLQESSKENVMPNASGPRWVLRLDATVR